MKLGIWGSVKPDDMTELQKGLGSSVTVFQCDGPTEDYPVVMAMGGEVLKSLQQRGAVPKGRTITSCRGKPWKTVSGEVFITYSPGMRASQADAISQIVWDIRLAKRYVETGGLNPVLGAYSWIDDFSDLIERIQLRLEDEEYIDYAFDTETMGLWPFYKDKHIVTLQISIQEGEAFAIDLRNKNEREKHQIGFQLRWILNHPKLRLKGANLKFDLVWIAQKFGVECTNFTMDTTVIGSLLDENRSNSLNWHTKEKTDLGGYDDCVAVGTKVCTADLRWVPVESVKAGDLLVGFDEAPKAKQRRKMRVAVAESTKILIKPGVLVTLDDGTQIRCSDDHGFVAHTRTYGNGPFEWVRAKALKVGARVMNVVPVVQENPSREAGYLAGLYDGEGYVSKAKWGLVSGISQRPGTVWDRYSAGMHALGYGGFYSLQRNGDGVHTSKHSGWSTLRLLQELRPQRLLDKHAFNDRCVPSGAPVVRVVSVTPIGPLQVVSLQTSTKTFVAEGIASHNSFNEKYDKGHMEKIPPEDLLPYAAGDADACLRVANVFRKELSRERYLSRFYVKLLHPALRAFEKIERRGVLIDAKIMKELRGEVVEYISSREKQLIDMLSPKLRAAYGDDMKDKIKEGKSPLTAKILREHFFDKGRGLGLKPKMFTEKTSDISTSVKHFMMFHDDDRASGFVTQLEEMEKARKTLTTYIDGFLQHLRPDGHFHPTYMLFNGDMFDAEDVTGGTNTGRLSCKNPALQTLPKHTIWAKKLRAAYVAPPGKVCWQFDFSQGELRITAVVANERTMISAYKNNLDLHAVTGARLAGIDFETFIAMKTGSENEQDLFGRYRSRAKPANFGLLYGMGSAGFQEYARVSYGVKLSDKEAEQSRTTFFETYPGLPTWHTKYKTFAKNNKFVASPLGRIRHLPLINSFDSFSRSRSERQAINAPIQGTLSDLCIWACARIEEELGDQASVIGMTHDAAYGYMDEDRVDELMPQIRDIMESLPYTSEFGWESELTFPVDGEVGSSMATMKAMKLA